MSQSTWEELWWVSFVILGVWIVNGVLIFYLLTRIDAIVNVQLYNYGLQFSNDWADPYWSNIRLAMVFLGLPMALSVVAFILGSSKFRNKIPFLKRKAKAEEKAEEKIEAQPEEQQSTTEVITEPEVEAEQELARESTEFSNEPQEVTTELANEPQLEVIPPETVQVQESGDEETGAAPITSSEETSVVKEETVAVSEEPKAKERRRLGETCPYCGKTFSRSLVMLDFNGGKARLVSSCPFCSHVLDDGSNPVKSEEHGEN